MNDNETPPKKYEVHVAEKCEKTSNDAPPINKLFEIIS